MNYPALAGGIFAALWALYALSRIVRVSLGNGRWHDDNWGFTINALAVTLGGTLAVWMFGMVAA